MDEREETGILEMLSHRFPGFTISKAVSNKSNSLFYVTKSLKYGDLRSFKKYVSRNLVNSKGEYIFDNECVYDKVEVMEDPNLVMLVRNNTCNIFNLKEKKFFFPLWFNVMEYSLDELGFENTMLKFMQYCSFLGEKVCTELINKKWYLIEDIFFNKVCIMNNDGSFILNWFSSVKLEKKKNLA